MAALTSDFSVIASNNKDEILDEILNSQTDDIAVEISPVEGYSEIKMLSSPFGAAMLSPGSEIIRNENFLCSSPTSDNNGSVTGIASGSSDNDNIPQWKKDLIQRRKINIARTIGANQSVTCPKKGFLDALETTKQQKQEEDVTKITSSPTSVLSLTKPNLFILKSPNNSNNNSSTNSISLDDSNSSEYLEVNLDGSRHENLNNDDDNIDGCSIPAKNTIKTQHKQQYNNYKYGDNNDIKSNNDDEIDNSDYIETGISGGQYTINNMKNINKSGNTVIIKSPQKDQQQQATSQIKNNFSTPIPKQRYSLNQINNSPSPTGEILLATSVAAEHLINNNIRNTSNSSSLCSETTSNNLNNTDIINSSVNSNSISDEHQQQQLSSALLPSSSLSTTSSIQLHSKHDTVKLSNEIAASSCSSNEFIKTTVGLGNNNLTINNKKCGIVSTNQNFHKNSNNSINNNKYIKNPQNSSSTTTTVQKIKIKKMVSAQDMNDSAGTTTTTTPPCHNQIPPTILLDDNDSTLSQFNDFDSSEELQYGPGIVSKLRVRYLSLALRQTTAKQRTHLDNLRRATSLNNLLDGGGSTGSTNDGSIIDGDIENESNLNVHHHHQQQQQILNHITHQHQNNHNQQQNKIHKNVSWLNQKEQQNSNSLIKKFIKEQEYLNSNIDDDDDNDDHIENSKEFDIEKNNGKFLYEKNYKKPENFYNKTGINNYQQNIQKKELLQQQQRNGRQVKRGNDSLKRARSVEALLCEKSSWLNNNNKNTSISGKMSISSGEDCRSDGEMLLVTEKPESNEINLIGIDNNIIVGNNQKNLLNQNNIVTIEDKIVNARERLHTPIEKLSPPKRLTSFIDDTERPPPDLVKQTLKLFEATANRRNGRNLSRNTNSQVAVKIANYKSIISQEKPIISYPKPPLSPKRNSPTSANNVIVNKKPNTLDLKTTTKSNTVGKKSNNSPINSPVSSLTKKFSGIENNETDSNKYKSSICNQQSLLSPTTATPPQILPRNNLNHQIAAVSTTDSPITHLTNKLNRLKIQNNNSDSPISPQERTPDIIPRKHFENFNNQTTTTDSPITQLSKKLNNLNIQSPVVTLQSTTTDGHNKKQFTAKSIDELTYDTDDSITTSDDDPDGCNNDGVTKMTKRISKTALENISKAGTTQHFSFNNNNSSNKMNNDQLNHSTPAKQVGIIRPLVAELKKDNSLSIVGGGDSGSSNNGACSIDNIKPQRDNLVISNLSQTKNQFNNNNTSKTKFIDNTKTGKNSTTIDKPALTTREIEKNLINEKKNELANLETTNNCDGGSGVGISTPPIWQLNKKIKIGSHNGQPIETQNNIMVFNFQDRKDVPDYIENDGLLIKRRRELPKPNESGFVLLGDLTLETSTDPDESWTMGPPSPCNVEFENANIIIDGKSNLRYRSKEVSLRVQFDDTLTSTFEYPSESSFSDDSVPIAVESFSSTIDSLEHIDADEIIQIPNVTPITTLKSPTSITMGQKSLGNMSLGSAPLGSYTPVKAQIQTNFELGITRVPNNTTTSNQMNGSSNSLNDNIKNQQMNEGGTSKDLINSINNATSNNNKTTDVVAASNDNITEINDKNNEPESLQYLKPATDDLTVVYSEGTQKTDLLY